MSHKSTQELIDQFIQNAILTTAIVERVAADAESLCSALTQATQDDELVLFADAVDINPELFTTYKSNPKVVTNPTKEQLAIVRTGITDAFCGIARTGSVCVPYIELTSPISMLTRKHIVVVDSKTILPNPRDVFSEEYLNGKGLKRSFSFITGPSATADMGPLVRGVHGPGKLHIIVLEQL